MSFVRNSMSYFLIMKNPIFLWEVSNLLAYIIWLVVRMGYLVRYLDKIPYFTPLNPVTNGQSFL